MKSIWFWELPKIADFTGDFIFGKRRLSQRSISLVFNDVNVNPKNLTPFEGAQNWL
jgi:hypothetical protein